MRARLVGEADFESDKIAERGGDFVAEPLRDRAGCDAPRLGVADDAEPSAAEFHADLRNLRGLARARITADNDHGMAADRIGDFGSLLRDRKRVVVLDAGGVGVAIGENLVRLGTKLIEMRQNPVDGLMVGHTLPRGRESRAKDRSMLGEQLLDVLGVATQALEDVIVGRHREGDGRRKPVGYGVPEAAGLELLAAVC